MQQLFINGKLMDLAQDTVIGITIQSNDISTVDKKKFVVSNSFKIPKTANNRRNLEFNESPFSTTDLPYDKLTANYYDANIHLIVDGKCFLESVDDHYNITILPDGDILDTLKEKNFRELLRDSFVQLTPTFNTLSAFVNDLVTNQTGGYCVNNVTINEVPAINQLLDGAICVYVSKVFEWIEDFTGYDLIHADTLTDDANFNKLSIPFYDLIVFNSSAGGGVTDFNLYLYDDPFILGMPYSSWLYQAPANTYDWYGEKTVLDFLKTIAVLFCCILEIDSANKTIKFHKLNDVISNGSVQDWTNKLIKKTKKFSFSDYAQTNNINWKHDDGVSENLGQVVFDCNNVNIDLLKDYEIDLIIPRYSGPYQSQMWWALGSLNPDNTQFTSKCLSEFMIFIEDSASSGTVSVAAYYGTGGGAPGLATASVNIMEVLMYDFSGNYSELENLLTNLEFYECDLYLNQLDIYNFKVDNLYKIDELGGVFYVNKIIGYNSKSKQGTKVELIKIK